MKKKTILFASLLLGGFSLMGTLPAAAAVRDTSASTADGSSIAEM